MKLYRLVLTVGSVYLSVPGLVLAEELMTVQKERVYGEPTEHTAIVYVVRPASFQGKVIKSWAFVDQEPIGVNKGKHYTFASVEPGKHVFWARAENTSALELDIEAGKTYYLKQKVKTGALKARIKLIQIDETEGQVAVEKCKYTQLTEAGRARALEIVEGKYETALKKSGSGDDEP